MWLTDRQSEIITSYKKKKASWLCGTCVDINTWHKENLLNLSANKGRHIHTCMHTHTYTQRIQTAKVQDT